MARGETRLVVTYKDYLKHREYAFNNKDKVQISEKAACFYCLACFDAAECVEFTDEDNDDTAICPKCGVDFVLPDTSGLPITDVHFMTGMQFWALTRN